MIGSMSTTKITGVGLHFLLLVFLRNLKARFGLFCTCLKRLTGQLLACKATPRESCAIREMNGRSRR